MFELAETDEVSDTINDTKPVKQIFATVNSTIDIDNSSNTVLLFQFL